MLVLSRRERQCVLLGDEVTVTVEAIRDSNGERIPGATVRLGFESPSYVAISRGEVAARRDTGSGRGKRGMPKPARPERQGRIMKVSDVSVRLRIRVPSRIPVSCRGKTSVHATTTEHCFTCGKEDRIKICNNIEIVPLEFHRFVPKDIPACC